MDVVIVGSCNTDLISYTPRLPNPGETIHGHEFSMGFGGKGANQCVAAGRLGASVAMVAKVGNDIFGTNYIQNFKDNGVNIDHVHQTDEKATGVAPITVDDKGQNSIIIVSGANMLLSGEDVLAAEATIKSAKVLVCQLEIEPATTLAALRLARKHGVKTILNPAPAQESLDPEMYKNTDIFCPNETEAEILTGMPIKSVPDAMAAIPLLLARGCGAVIVTMGGEGSVYGSHGNATPIHVPTEKVTPLDSTGAGDSFIGSLSYFLSRHNDLDLGECIRRAGKVATLSVQAQGTQKSYPWRKNMDDQLFV